MAGRTVHLINIASPFREGIADLKRPPSGILYVGGYLREHGFPVVVHHIDESRIGKTVDEIVSDDSALCAGFSLMTGRQVSSSALMSARLKESRSDIPIVWGGVHPSLMPRGCLDFGFVDYVVVGEGEITGLELCAHLAGGVPALEDIKGIAWRNARGEIVESARRPFAESLDAFRQDFSLVDMKDYIVADGRARTCYFITSRGCPHSCGFCYNQTFNARRWRAHSTERVVGELKGIRDAFGITSVIFDDDNFFTNRRRGLEILREIRKIGISCDWVELRVDYITEELLSELAGLGVRTIFMGWESGNAGTLKRIAKGFSPGTILEKSRILAKFPSMTVDASAIVGFPWEGEKEIADTVSLALEMFRINRYRLNFNIGLYVPYPGAPVTAEAESRGFAFPRDHRGWSDYDILAGTLELPWLTRRQVERCRLVDRYAKMLFVPPTLAAPARIACKAMAVVAMMRIRYGVFVLPFEIGLQSAAMKIVLKARSRRA